MVWEYIKQAVLASLSFVSSVLGATAGIFLYPLVNLFRLTLTTLLFILTLPILIPYFAVMFGVITSRAGLGVIAAIVVSIGSLFALIGLAVCILPALFLANALLILLPSPIDGFKIGWNEGLFSLLTKSFSLCVFGRPSRFQEPQQPEHWWEFAGANGMDYHAILVRFEEAAANARRRPMTLAEFDACELSQADFFDLKSTRLARLTDAEIRQLEPSDIDDRQMSVLKRRCIQGEILSPADMLSLKAAKEFEAYKDLRRLETDTCSILADRPERDNTILLVKQYKDGDRWFPVPGVVNVHDKESLQTWLVGREGLPGNAVHPSNRDLILAPPRYQVGLITYETRYIFHPYYVAEEGVDQPGVSHEVNQFTAILRARLRQMRVAVGHVERDEHVIDMGAAFSLP